MKSVLVYCGSRSGNSPTYAKAAYQLGKFLAEEKYRLLFGGCNMGLMGTLSNTVLDNYGEVIGIIPLQLIDKERVNPRCTELRVVKNMQERKALIEELADIIITLPGGYGSMDELFESLANIQMGVHQKPIILLNTNGFYLPLIAQLDKMTDDGFLLKENRAKVLVADTTEDLIKLLSKIVSDK